MIPEEERLEKLRDAYSWEQERIDAWLDDLHNHEDGSNPMIARFYVTWKAYFKEVKASNQCVIDTCTQGLAAGRAEENQDDQRASFIRTIRKINRVEHRKGSVSAISNTANTHRRQSGYFKSLDEVIDLDNEARDYIENYLVDGKP